MGRRHSSLLLGFGLAAMILAAGCDGESPAGSTGATDQLTNGPAPAGISGAGAEAQGFSELGIAFALPRGLRITARSPEDHELRLAGRPSLNTAVTGRMALVSREGKSQVLADAMTATVDHWNETRRKEDLPAWPDTRPNTVENFHVPGQNNLSIVKMRMQVQKPLPSPPGSDPNEAHQADLVAVGYFVALQTKRPATAERAEQTLVHSVVAVFVLEAAPAAEAELDGMIQSIRGMD